MRLHFPVSATITARRWLVDGQAGWGKAVFPIRYGVMECGDGIALVDTGYSADLFAAREWALYTYRWILGPKLDPANDAVALVNGLGARAVDVRSIVVTHLHADHICGLGGFPNATLHMSRQSLALWSARPGFRDHRAGLFRSLLPDLSRFAVRAVEDAPERALPWGGRGHDVFGDGSVLSVDLPGHMQGHIGLFFPEQQMFYAVDADWTAAPLLSGREPNWPVRMIVHDREAAKRSAATVRAAAAWGAKILLCHEPLR